jgi:Dof domain, zinc finger
MSSSAKRSLNQVAGSCKGSPRVLSTDAAQGDDARGVAKGSPGDAATTTRIGSRGSLTEQGSEGTTKKALKRTAPPPPSNAEPVECPRCSSKATKFCYYNVRSSRFASQLKHACVFHLASVLGSAVQIAPHGCLARPRTHTQTAGTDVASV